MINGLKYAGLTIGIPLLLCGIISLSYSKGYGHGKAQGEAALQALNVDRAGEKQREAEVFVKALAEAVEAHEAETVRVNELARQLQREKQKHEQENRALQRRIAEVAGSGSHVFGTDFICMLNAAAGVCDPSATGTAAAGLADYGTSPCSAFGPGLLERFEGVGEADLLAWFVAYADRCKTMENQLSGWRNYAGKEDR